VIARATEPLARAADRLRNPEYTGEGRCVPCTLVNLLIAAALGAALAAVWLPVGVALFCLSLAAIYLRGYLVPGTPTLTKRYLPDRVLRIFDKEPAPAPTFDDVATVEAFLLRHDAVTESPDGDDLQLTPAFEATWRDRMAAVDTDDALLAGILDAIFDGVDADLDAGELSLDRRAHALVLSYEGRTVSRWESRAAVTADVAAAVEFADRSDDWDAMDPDVRLQVLGALRLWLDRCPSCGGAVTLDQEVVESCCRSVSVVAATCDDCDSRVFEAEYDGALEADDAGPGAAGAGR
jgi:hypothetical protein